MNSTLKYEGKNSLFKYDFWYKNKHPKPPSYILNNEMYRRYLKLLLILNI